MVLTNTQQQQETYMAVQNLIKYDPPKMLSLREAQIAGSTAHRLMSLRHMLTKASHGATLAVSSRREGGIQLSLSPVDTEALIALLIERDIAFLTGLNVETSD